MINSCDSGPDTADGRLTLAAVLPAYNEALHIQEVLRAVPPCVDRIIVVDDASVDGTYDQASAVEDPRVVVLQHAQNQGVGAAMRTGYRHAILEGVQLIAKIDADGQMPLSELERLLVPLSAGSADYVKGNRFYFRNATIGMPAERGVGNAALSFLTKLASGYWHVFDSQCGFTVARSSFLALLDLDQVASDYFFENDMLIRMNALNARVVDVPISTIYGSEVSDVSIRRVLWSFPPRLVGGGLRRFWRKHLVTDFGPIAAFTVLGWSLSIFGAAFGAYHWWLSIVTGVVASTGTVMLAVLPLILGIQCLLQAFSLEIAASPGAEATAQYVRRLIQDGEFR